MKTVITITALLFTSLIFSQNKKPTFQTEGNLVKGTYFHDNGEIKQTGTYKEGKLHGEWISFNDNGDKVAVGEYFEGRKNGKWFFWDGDKLSEVNYNNNKITSIKEWESNSSVVANFTGK